MLCAGLCFYVCVLKVCCSLANPNSLFGTGTYFANDAAYSDYFCLPSHSFLWGWYKQMLVVRVAAGRFERGKQNMDEPTKRKSFASRMTVVVFLMIF